jgi:hypothetical protein
MKRLLAWFLAICLSLLCTGCGNIFIQGSFQPGSSSVSGMVSVIQLSSVIGSDGATVLVTFVTFLQEGTSSTIGFCGDQRDRFPFQQTVRADFNPGQNCSSIIVIVIL